MNMKGIRCPLACAWTYNHMGINKKAQNDTRMYITILKIDCVQC